MKKMMVWLSALMLGLMLWAGSAQAQHSYGLGLGAKIGSPLASVSVKYSLGSHSALEGLANVAWYGLGTTVLYEYHIQFDSHPGWRWYFGGGGHFATSRPGYYNPYADGYYADIQVGIDGVIGVEYTFGGGDFTVGMDITPLINLNVGVTAWWNAGIYFRYNFF